MLVPHDSKVKKPVADRKERGDSQAGVQKTAIAARNPRPNLRSRVVLIAREADVYSVSLFRCGVDTHAYDVSALREPGPAEQARRQSEASQAIRRVDRGIIRIPLLQFGRAILRLGRYHRPPR